MPSTKIASIINHEHRVQSNIIKDLEEFNKVWIYGSIQRKWLEGHSKLLGWICEFTPLHTSLHEQPYWRAERIST